MPDAQNEDQQAGVFNLADKPEVADTIFPEFPEPGALQCFADAARIVQLRYPFPEKLQNPPRVLRVEFA